MYEHGVSARTVLPADSKGRSACSEQLYVVTSRPDRSLMLLRSVFLLWMQLHEGISSRDLKTGIISTGPALFLHRAVEKLGAKIEAAHRIPDQVDRRIATLVIGVGRLERSVLYLHKASRRTRSYYRGPVMLITAIRSKQWQRSQRQIPQRYGGSVEAQSCSVAHIPRDSMAVHKPYNNFVLTVHLHTPGSIHAPSKSELVYSIWQLHPQI